MAAGETTAIYFTYQSTKKMEVEYDRRWWYWWWWNRRLVTKIIARLMMMRRRRCVCVYVCVCFWHPLRMSYCYA
jgi:hypothetical protein